MEKSTKIYLGVGAAALVAFLVLRNKAAAQKQKPTGKDDCPAGQIRVQPKCKKAPCNSYCQPIEDFSNEEDYGYKKECPAGTKPCVNNPSKCVSTNPNINYIVDPCDERF